MRHHRQAGRHVRVRWRPTSRLPASRRPATLRRSAAPGTASSRTARADARRRRLVLFLGLLLWASAAVAATPRTAFAQVPEARVVAWGVNYWGQVGDGTAFFGGDPTPDPVVLPESTTLTAIDGSHTNSVTVTGQPSA